MKKIIALAAFAALLISCSEVAETPTQPQPQITRVARLVSTAKNIPVITKDQITTAPLIADIKVSEKKLYYIYVPSKAAQAEGEENCVKCAIREALRANGDGDIIIGMETQVKFDGTYYNGHAVVESVVVSGYPAWYVNFRHPDNEYWSNGLYLLPPHIANPPQEPVIIEKQVDEGYHIKLQDNGGGVAEVKFPMSFSFGKNKEEK